MVSSKVVKYRPSRVVHDGWPVAFLVSSCSCPPSPFHSCLPTLVPSRELIDRLPHCPDLIAQPTCFKQLAHTDESLLVKHRQIHADTPEAPPETLRSSWGTGGSEDLPRHHQKSPSRGTGRSLRTLPRHHQKLLRPCKQACRPLSSIPADSGCQVKHGTILGGMCWGSVSWKLHPF